MMNQDLIARARQLAIEVGDLQGDDRLKYLDEACRDDSALRLEVDALIDRECNTTQIPTKLSHTPEPQQIGPYHVVRKLGEGGMGTVWLAEQTAPIHRRVALKIIKLGMDTREVIARFESERQALALMDHPNVAKVFDAGASEHGRPYFVMELVEGESITEYCDRQRLTTKRRLELFIPVCHALQHAHQKGIIHRDIKPSNILVAMHQGKPVTKVIDFGVAKATEQKLTERTLYTEQGQLIGTPEYMSPEQAEMTAINVDTRTDVYSLGVVLYELLVGALPFESQSLRRGAFNDVQRIIREQEPLKPSTRLSGLGDDSRTSAKRRSTDKAALERQLRGDLDWITMKAIQKDRTLRYDTAVDLAADIGRYLNHEPVLAGPPSAAYRLRKFVRRNRAFVIGATAATIILVVGVTVSTILAVRESRARAEAVQARDNLQVIVDFQKSMISGIDAETMGARMLADLRSRIRTSLETDRYSQEDIESALATFDVTLRRANATDSARELMDQQILGRAVKAIDRDFANQPLVRAALQQTVADAYRILGLYESALPLQKASLSTRRRELGDNDPDTLRSITRMGVLLHSQGKLVDAEPYYQEALRTRRRILGDEHPNTLASINNMGYLLSSKGKFTEAEPYYREALDTKRRVFGNEHPDTLLSIGNMGALLKSQGKLDEAESYYTEALDTRRKVHGGDHPNTLVSIGGMGAFLQSQGRLTEAEPYYREVLETKRRVFGDEHPNTLSSIQGMGTLLQSQGKLDAAEPYYRTALSGRRRILGNDHPATLSSINGMGHLLRLQGKHDEAEPYYSEAMQSRLRILGADHPDTLESINNMGEHLQSQGKYAEAEPLIRQAVTGFHRVLGEDHFSTISAINNLGGHLQSRGKYAEAEPFIRQAVTGFRRSLGKEHTNTLAAVNNLGFVLQSQGRFAEAEPFLRDASKGYREALGGDHANTLTSRSNLALVLIELGDIVEAEQLTRETVFAARKTLSSEHWLRGNIIGKHGRALAALKRFDEAESALCEAHGVLVAALGDTHEQTTRVIKYIIELYEAWGNPSKVDEWRSKLQEFGP